MQRATSGLLALTAQWRAVSRCSHFSTLGTSHCSNVQSMGVEAGSASTSEPLQPCGKGDNRTRRGKIYRGTYRQSLPKDLLHPARFPGGPAFHAPGEHCWREEPFRYPGERPQGQAPRPPAAPAQVAP